MSRRPTLPEPDELLAGRVRATVEQLFALIHDVNPTDRGLSPRQQAEHYALKARLQSLLVRRHPELLEVHRDAVDERVVTLRHRGSGRDACHAVVAALDEDARRWVEAELLPSEQTTVAPLTPLSAPGSTRSNDRLRAGLEALDAYDYEEARQQLGAAFDESMGSPPAARALLDLLVNHLCEDQAALELEGRLSRQALSDPEVRGTLAVAAARVGERNRARGHLSVASREASLEALVYLAEIALREGALEEAKRDLVSCRELDPTHPALIRLEDTLTTLEAERRRPLEEPLAAALAAEDWGLVERITAEIFAKWPGNAAARGAQARMEEARAHAEALRLAKAAQAALDQGEVAAVPSLVRRARALGASQSSLLRELDALETRLSERLQDLARERVSMMLSAGDRRAGLLTWTALPAAARRAIQQLSPLPEMTWLEALPADEAGVDAACALQAAREAFDQGELEAASSILARHERTLRRLPAARSLSAEIEAARAARAEQQAAVARDAVAEARCAGEHERALRLAAELPSAERRAVEAEIEVELRRLEHARRAVEAEGRGDLLMARDEATQAGDLDAVRALSARIRLQWRVEVHDVDIGVMDVDLPWERRHGLPWLTPDGQALAYVEVRARYVFVREIALPSLEVRRVLTLCAPGSMVPAYVILSEGTLTIVDVYGAVLKLRWSDGEPLLWRPRPLTPPESPTHVQGTVLAPGGRYVWLRHWTGSGWEVRIYDVERWPASTPTSRENPHPWGCRVCEFEGWPAPLIGCEVPTVAVLGEREGVTLFRPSGAPPGKRLPSDGHLFQRVAVLADGRPLVGLITSEEVRVAALRSASAEFKPQVRARPVGLYRTSSDADASKIRLFGGSDMSAPSQIGTDRARGCVRIKMSPGASGRILTEWMDGSEPKGSWVPATTTFFVDAGSRHVHALATVPEGLRYVAFDAADEEVDVHALDLLWLRTVWSEDALDVGQSCEVDLDTLTTLGDRLRRVLGAMSRPDRDREIEALRVMHAEDPTGLYDLAAALFVLEHGVEGEAIVEETRERFPDHPRSRLYAAILASRDGLWEEAQAKLQDLDTTRLEPAFAQHALHLRGLALLHTGSLGDGASALRAAQRIGGACEDALLFELTLVETLEGVPAPVASDDWQSCLQIRLHRQVQTILQADQALERGDLEAALALFDHPDTWRIRERQGLARLAEAWLRVEPEDPRLRLRRRIALASFLDAHEGYLERRTRELPLPPHTWGPARLDDLAARVRAALDAG